MRPPSQRPQLRRDSLAALAPLSGKDAHMNRQRVALILPFAVAVMFLALSFRQPQQRGVSARLRPRGVSGSAVALRELHVEHRVQLDPVRGDAALAV